jgi:hypothetical protein
MQVGACIGTPTATIGQISIVPNPAHTGQQVAISAYISLSCTAPAAVLIEVYENAYTKTIMKLPDFHEQFAAGQTRLVTITGTIPATAQLGMHQIIVGVFDPTWKHLYGYAPADLTLQVS